MHLRAEDDLLAEGAVVRLARVRLNIDEGEAVLALETAKLRPFGRLLLLMRLNEFLDFLVVLHEPQILGSYPH